MSDTPRTDSRVFRILSDLQSGTREVVDAPVSRQLERELNAKPEQSPSGEGVELPNTVAGLQALRGRVDAALRLLVLGDPRVCVSLSASSQKVHVTPEKGEA